MSLVIFSQAMYGSPGSLFNDIKIKLLRTSTKADLISVSKDKSEKNLLTLLSRVDRSFARSAREV